MAKSHNSVSIDIVTSEDRISMDGGGAIQIVVDNERVNKYVDEDDWEPEYGWKEYAGDDTVADLTTIIDTTIEICEDPELYEERRVRFAGYSEYLILEYLGDGMIRVAYRTEPDLSDDSFDFLVVPSNACGYTVRLQDWAEAVCDAVERLQGALRENDEGENAEWFAPKLAELKENI